jgi:hypothetical protein
VQSLNKVKTGSTEAMQYSEALCSLKAILADPSCWRDEMDRFSGSVLSVASYGIHLESPRARHMAKLRDLVGVRLVHRRSYLNQCSM